MISAFGIIISLVTSIIAYKSKAETFKGVSNVLKLQLLWSTIFATPALYLAGELTLPERIYGFATEDR